MLKEERQSMILEIVNVRNKIRSTELSEHLKVSEDTIRRDLRELAEGGFIKKVHGGALANPKTPEAIHRRGLAPLEEMQIIAQKVLPLIEEDQVIILDGGGIIEHLVTLLDPDMNLTIFTNSILVADRLAELPAVDTFMLGGRISGKSRIVSGIDVTQMLAGINADLCLLEVSSIHADFGLTSNNRSVSLTKKAMVESASTSIGLCLSEVIGRIQPFRIVPLEKLEKYATEVPVQSVLLHSLLQKGATFI